MPVSEIDWLADALAKIDAPIKTASRHRAVASVAKVRPIYSADYETDPFAYEQAVSPFCCAIYDGSGYKSFWGKDCTERFIKAIRLMPPGIIYFHNGGRFDIFAGGLLKYVTGNLIIIGGRITSCNIGEHEIRDSFSIVPVALATYKKDEIDYHKLEASVREQHRAEILKYLRSDCVYLHELVSAFVSEFGDFITIGSAAMSELRKFHPFEFGNRFTDEKFRDRFFFGGRVQCFRKSGVYREPFQIDDVNSMYPYVMKNYRHPMVESDGSGYEPDIKLRKDTFFVVAEGKQIGPYGAFPTRDRKGGVSFLKEKGEFCVTIHEWNQAEQNGWFKPSKILRTYSFEKSECFDTFVDHFYNSRLKAKQDGNVLLDLFYKLILNSAFGKFAQNPAKYKDHHITHGELLSSPWNHIGGTADGDYMMWQKKSLQHSYKNVAIGASITGAARAILMDGLKKADTPIYCDTDSIISRGLTGVTKGSKELGAWKLEATGDKIAIAGKKLYACFNGEIQGPVMPPQTLDDLQAIKTATKGARIPAREIIDVAMGKTVLYEKAAPTYHLDGSTSWIHRKIRATV